jgi:hypothetical protein
MFEVVFLSLFNRLCFNSDETNHFILLECLAVFERSERLAVDELIAKVFHNVELE